MPANSTSSFIKAEMIEVFLQNIHDDFELTVTNSSIQPSHPRGLAMCT
jgi:hypothetical protein